MVYRAFLVFFNHYMEDQLNTNEEVAKALLKRAVLVYFLKMFQYNLARRLARRYS